MMTSYVSIWPSWMKGTKKWSREWIYSGCALVPQMAREGYDNRCFEQLPILDDALQDAGCADACILAHCRQAEKHVRGCWLVDALLGKT